MNWNQYFKFYKHLLINIFSKFLNLSNFSRKSIIKFVSTIIIIYSQKWIIIYNYKLI